MFLVFSGKKGAGKDTICAEIIKRNPHIKMVRVGLADYLKEICINLYNLDRKVCYGPNKDIDTKYYWRDMPWYNPEKHLDKFEKKVTHREFLQYFGSEICRSIDDKCWVNHLLNSCTDTNTIYCVTDVRFPSELKPLTCDIGTIVLRLLRNPFNDNHQSEVALDNWIFHSNEILDNSSISIDETVELAIKLFNEQSSRYGHKERLK